MSGQSLDCLFTAKQSYIVFRQVALRYPAASPILRGPFIFLGGFASEQKTLFGAINAVAPSIMKFMRHTCFALLEPSMSRCTIMKREMLLQRGTSLVRVDASSSGRYRGDPAQTIQRTIVGSRKTPYVQLLL